MSDRTKRLLFALFFISGFSSLLYQVVWLRLAFASFGIITPVLSLVLSTFMLGLAVGSWLGGAIAGRLPGSKRLSALQLYGAAEACIGIGAFAVPRLFRAGESLLLSTGATDSMTYLGLSAAVIALSLFPFCLCMGTTFPLMMAYVRERDPRQETSFSFLYLANVVGAMCGTLVTAIMLVEVLGFTWTLAVGACGNFLVAAVSFSLARRAGEPDESISARYQRKAAAPTIRNTVDAAWLAPLILFTTGLVSMALEVVWTRAFTPVLKTQVYSFATLLFVYLLSTWIGSFWYRQHLGADRVVATRTLLVFLAIASFAQLLIDDPRIHSRVVSVFPDAATNADSLIDWIIMGIPAAIVLLSIAPFCGILGYLTPKLIDEYSTGRPQQAGNAYALNVVGCILGPLVASYVLLPAVGIKWSTVVLAAPLALLALAARQAAPTGHSSRIAFAVLAATVVLSCVFATSYEEQYAGSGAVIRRDHTATVISHITETGAKGLMVNGKEITGTTPTTKIMAHMPLAFLQHQPKSALVICFGMGTTYRSLLTWDIDVTAVELVPSVRDAFDYYFTDAEQILANPRGKIVIDDGRRFLERTDQQFDVITLDPPPPPEAAGSSLLYSEQFYALCKRRLAPGGILQQWFPGGDRSTFEAILRAIRNEFPHVVAYRAHDGWGVHFLASQEPIVTPNAEQFETRLPPAAKADLVEWNPGTQPRQLIDTILAPDRLLNSEGLLGAIGPQTITDDRPYNEYYLLRRLWQKLNGMYEIVL